MLKESCNFLSTIEADYIAIRKTAKRIVWPKGLLEEINGSPVEANLYIDSAGAMKLTTIQQCMDVPNIKVLERISTNEHTILNPH